MSALALTLDRSRDHATVHGENKTHDYEQDGLPFDFQGRLVEKMLRPEQKAVVEKKLRRIAKLSGETDAAKPAKVEAADPDDADDDDKDIGAEMNFEAWLKDEVKYPVQEVFREAKKRYSKVFSNYFELAEFLVEVERILPAEQVPSKLRRG